MNLLHYLWSFLLALAILIFFHELGHYLVARWCGIRVLRFSIGFGRVLFSRRIGADKTEWCICLFPLGGYVKMLDEREDPVPESERHRAFNTQSLWKRSLVVAAGPLANFLLAIVIYWGGFVAGSTELIPQIGRVQAGSVAERAGFVPGERVVRIGDDEIRSWADVRWSVIDGGLSRARIEVETQSPDGGRQLRMLDLSSVVIDDHSPDALNQIGLEGPLPELPAVVGKLLPGDPAEQAGLHVGDRILAVDGKSVSTFRNFASLVSASPGKALTLTVQRGQGSMQVSVVPKATAVGDKQIGRIGVAPQILDDQALAKYLVDVRDGPLQGVQHAASFTWKMSVFSLEVLGRMITGQVSLRNVSGPIAIADYAGQSASMGFAAYLRFLALISISLGVLNLLPVPILDGGHLLYHALEAVRGKPLSERFLDLTQRLGFGLLMALMALALFNDLNRLLLR